MENEYDMPMTEELKEEVNNMCNVSALYWNGGVAEGLAKGLSEGEMREKIATILEMAKEHLPIEIIAKVARLSIPETEKLLRNTLKNKQKNGSDMIIET